MTIGASDVQAFIGMNGPYRPDTDGNDLINEFDDTNDVAMGFSALRR